MSEEETKKPETNDDAEQPKVFEISGADMEDMDKILGDESAMEAIASGKAPKKKGSDRAPAEGGAIPDKVLEVLRKKAEERDQYLDRLQRVQAEYANFQKRTKKERVEWADRAVADFLEKLLPVLDGFDGARRTSETDDVVSLRQGIEVLRSTLWKILTDAGVNEIDADGLPFDPRVHEAVMQEYTETADEGRILEVFQTGYMFREKVIRASRVKIARAGAPPEAAAPQEEPSDETEPAGEKAAAELADSADEATRASAAPAAAASRPSASADEETQEIDPEDISPILDAVDADEERKRGIKLEGDIDTAHESYDTEMLGPPLSDNPLLDEPEDQPHA